MRALQISSLAFAVMLAVLIGFNSAGAADAKELTGWGLDDPYHKLYKFKESEKFKATVVKVLEVVPIPGMSPGAALEVREGSETILVHICPVGYAKPSEIGFKPGDKVTIRGCWAEVGVIVQKGVPSLESRTLNSKVSPFLTLAAMNTSLPPTSAQQPRMVTLSPGLKPISEGLA